MLLDPHRLEGCSEALVEERGTLIVGSITLGIAGRSGCLKGKLDVLYVLHDYRRSGIGQLLLEEALNRLLALGTGTDNTVECELQSSRMARLIARLTPDLRAVLEVRPEDGQPAVDFADYA
jgi:ribosomal protein S18 acetylase RimI-like enzyme